MRAKNTLLTLLALAFLAAPAAANITIPGANNGSEGPLNVTSSTVIDLSKAVTGTWDQAGTGTGVGVYDSTKWAVVFKYSSVNISAGCTVTFINHPSNAPVVWLVQGVATIAGTVKLDGGSGVTTNRESAPGPGGFPGGRGTYSGSPSTAGQGPGGAPSVNDCMAGAAYGSVAPHGGGVVYGNSSILPLIGGSGGGGGIAGGNGGGAGGGAILIVTGQRCTLTGSIYSRGGAFAGTGNGWGGNGSGGAIRVIADTLSGDGTMDATFLSSYGGANGRIRLESNILTLSTQSSPAYSLEQPLDVDGVVIWPPAPEPTLRIATINGQPATGDPHMDAQALVSGDLVISRASSVPVTIAATNVPTNVTVTVRVVLGADPDYTTPAVFQSGDATISIWLATLVALSPQRVSAIQAKVVLP